MAAGVILAAGASRRFGAPKQLALLGGRSLLQRVIDGAVENGRLERVVVVIGSNAEAIEETITFGRSEPVRCDRWSEGISASLRCGLAALAGAGEAVIQLGDQPGVDSRIVSALLDELRPEDSCVRASFRGKPGHPVVVRSALFPALSGLEGDRGGRSVLEESGVRLIQCDSLGTGADIDTLEDLRRAEAAEQHPRGDAAGRERM